MARSIVAVLLALTPYVSEAGPCKRAPRFVFDPVGARHSLPQLTWDGTRYAVIGYDGPPTELQLTTFDLAKRKPVAVDLGPGGLAATATNGSQIAIAYLAVAPSARKLQIAVSPDSKPVSPDSKPRPDMDDGLVHRKADDDFLVIDGRRVHAPRTNRQQSFFMVVDTRGKVVVRPIALGDQRVMHVSPGVQVAWNPRDKEWGVVWSEFNYLKFARVDTKGRVLAQVPIVIDGFVQASSRMVWTGTRYAFLAATPKGITIYETDGKTVQPIMVAPGDGLEPVLAFDGTSYIVIYRTTRIVPQGPFVRDGKARPSPPMTPPPSPLHYLLFVTVKDGKPRAPVTLATAPQGRSINTPVIAVDGAAYVVVWGEQRKSASFDDRLLVTRIDSRGKTLAGYPRRLDDEETHQGYASIAGTGCDLAVSYILGDPNKDVRVGVVSAP